MRTIFRTVSDGRGVETTSRKAKEKAETKGAKCKYDRTITPNLERIRKWTEAGASQTEMAKKLGLSASTFKRYLSFGDKGQEPYTSLSAVLRTAAEVPDDNVEAAMYKRACGIYYDECTYETKWDEGAQEMVERCVRRVRKYIPPDPTSCMFWLANRRPDRWSYKPGEQEDNGKETGGVIIMPEVKEASGSGK